MAIELFLASAGQVRRKAHTAAIELLLASVGFTPNGVELRCLSHFFMAPS